MDKRFILTPVDQIDPDDREPTISLIGEYSCVCTNCNKTLLTILKVKDSDKTQKIQVVCPKCYDKTFVYELHGEVYICGANEDLIIANVETTKKDNIIYHLVEVKHGKT